MSQKITDAMCLTLVEGKDGLEGVLVAFNKAQERMEAGVIKAFEKAGITEFSKGVQAFLSAYWGKHDYKAGAIRTRISRIRAALKVAGWGADRIYTDNRGGKRAPQTGGKAAPKAEPAGDGAKFLEQFNGAMALVRNQANTFLSPTDQKAFDKLCASVLEGVKAKIAPKGTAGKA